MGASVRTIDAVYGHLVRGSEDAMRAKLDAFAAAEQAQENRLGVE